MAFEFVKQMQADGRAWKALMLDGLALARGRPVLVALGIRPDATKVLDFRLAASESAVDWERFLTGLYRRGLTGAGTEAICADGGQHLIPIPQSFFW